MRRIILRADGNNEMGLGHIYRSVALLEMLSDDYHCIFMTKCDNADVLRLLSEVVDEVVIMPIDISYDREIGLVHDKISRATSIVVLDGYHFDTEYQRRIKAMKCRVVCIDDIHESRFVADAVINHGAGATASDYEREPYTFLFLGLQFSLVRRFFYDRSVRTDKDQILVCLGGADPNNETESVLQMLIRNKENRQIHIVIGAAYQHADSLHIKSQNSGIKTTIHQSLRPREMAELMASCDTAITSPSTVAYEYLATGGRLYLQKIADNQARIYAALCGTGTAAPLSDYLGGKENNLSDIESKEFVMPDAQRNLQTIFNSLSMICRSAGPSDIDFIYEIASDPLTRSQSFHPAAISLSDHKVWMKQKMGDRTCLFYVVHLLNDRIGQIRFDIVGGVATISFSVHPDFRGRRYGFGIIIAGVQSAIQSTMEISRFEGFVKNSNTASQKAFEFASFVKRPASEYTDTSLFLREVA